MAISFMNLQPPHSSAPIVNELMRSKIENLEHEDFYLGQESATWTSFLPVGMAPGKFFVLKNDDNNYVVKARAISMDKKPVLSVEFCVNNSGWYQPLNEYGNFESVKDLCCNCFNETYEPLSKDEIVSMEKFSGKERFLERVDGNNPEDARFKKTMLSIIHQINCNFSPLEVNKLVESYPRRIFARFSVNPCSLPCFTLHGYHGGGRGSTKEKYAIKDGNLIRMQHTILVISSSKDKPIMENENEVKDQDLYKAAVEEYNTIKKNLPPNWNRVVICVKDTDQRINENYLLNKWHNLDSLMPPDLLDLIKNM